MSFQTNVPILIDYMKKRIKENETTKGILQEMVSDGLSEDEAMEIMIVAWLKRCKEAIE